MRYSDFINDYEKMYDFVRIPKKEFLESYSYLVEEEYDLTMIEYNKLTLFKKVDLFNNIGEELSLSKDDVLSLILAECAKADKEMLRLRYRVFDLECRMGGIRKIVKR